jgi:hypothetical protein
MVDISGLWRDAVPSPSLNRGSEFLASFDRFDAYQAWLLRVRRGGPGE